MVKVDDRNNGTRARALKLKFGHDAVRILNARLSAWRDCVANRPFAFTRGVKPREASLAAGLLAFTDGRAGAPCRIGTSLLYRRMSFVAKPVTTFAGHACSAHFALV
jgi:hypothetical protein